MKHKMVIEVIKDKPPEWNKQLTADISVTIRGLGRDLQAFYMDLHRICEANSCELLKKKSKIKEEVQ
jgi:hypothetical protein